MTALFEQHGVEQEGHMTVSHTLVTSTSVLVAETDGSRSSGVQGPLAP